MSDFDGAWKDTLDCFLKPFLAFFFPATHDDIDWTQEIHSLEQEFRPLAPTDEGGKVLCDKLLCAVSLTRSDPLYLHVEAQCQRRLNLGWRFYRYNIRATDKYSVPVVSHLLLGDEDPDWFPEMMDFRHCGYSKQETVPMQAEGGPLAGPDRGFAHE